MRHPKQGPKPGHTAGLTDINLSAIINTEGHGLVQLSATGTDDRANYTLLGQLTPAVAFGLAENLRQAAESALGDEVLFQVALDIVDQSTEEELTRERRLEEAQRVASGLIRVARDRRARLTGELVTEVTAELLEEEEATA